MADLTGRRLGKYELVDRLGRGGMAEVYKAYQPGMDRFVAVKVMHGHLAETEDFVTRFKREAQIVGQLRHPHILQVIDFDVDNDVYYMVMEYIKGDTLKAYIQKKGELTADESLRIIAKLADALFYAHSQGMIHRDIKPANVMFTDTTFIHPVLTDFGIARIVASGSQLTASGAFVGTPAYISPETARGESADERSDIYSMGVMFYEMLTGKVPFDADTPFAVIMKHVNEPLPSPRQFNIKVTDSVEQVLYTALAKRPDERYQTAQEFKVAVEKALVNLAHEHPTSAAHQTKSVATEDKTFTFVPGQEVSTMTYDKVNTAAQKAQVKDAPTMMGVTPKKSRLPLILGGVVVLVLLAVGGFFAFGQSDTNTVDNDTSGTDVAVNQAEIQKLLDEGDRLMRVGDNDKAVVSFGKAIALDPQNADLYVKRGVAYQRDGKNEEALVDFASAITLDNKDVEAYLSRAMLYRNEADYAKALEDYEQVLALDATNSTALTGKGLILQAQGESAQALNLLNNAVEANSTASEPLVARAELYLNDGEIDDAISDLNRAIALDDRNLEAYLVRAQAFIADGEYESALDDLDEVADRAPENAEVFLYRGQIAYEQEDYTSALNDLNKAISYDGSLTLAYRLRGDIQLENEKFDEALEDLTKVLQTDADAEAYTLRGWAYLGLDDTEAAINDFNEAVALDDTYADAYLGLGDVYTQDDPAKAIEAYNQAIELDKSNPDGYASRGWLYLEQGDTASAQSDFEAAIRLNPSYADAYEGLGEIYLAAEDNEKALENYDKAIENGGTSSWAYFGRGHAKSHLEQYPEAIADFTLALENDPEDPAEIYTERGWAYVQTEDYAAAIADLTLALEDDDSNAFALYGRGVANFYQGEFDAAITDLTAALDNGSEDTMSIRDYRGRAYLGLEDYEAAIAEYDAVLAEDNSNTEMLFNRGKAYLASGDTTSAIDDFNTIIERGYPTLEEVYTQRGIAYFKEDDDERAEADYEAAIAKNENYAEAYYQRALLNRNYLDSEDLRLADLNKVLEIDPTLAKAYYYRGEVYLETKDYEKAIEDYNKAEEFHFEPLAWVYNDRGVAYNGLGDDDEAIRNYTAAIDLDETFGLAYFNRGFTYYEIGNHERVLENMDLAIENDYINPAVAYFYKGDSQDELGEYEDALASLTMAIEIDPDYNRAYFLRGYVNDEVGNSEEAIADYTRALDLGYSTPEFAYNNRGYVYLNLEQYEDAVADFTQAIELDSNYSLAYYNRGIARYYLEEYEGAIEDYNAALDVGYEFPVNIYYNLGQVYFATGDYETAIANYTTAMDYNSDYGNAYLRRATAYIELGNTQAAIDDYNRYIEIGGFEDGEPYYDRGMLYVGLGEFDNAVDDFTKAIAMNRLYSEAYYQRGLAYVALEDTASAIGDFNQILQIDADNADAFIQLGDLYYTQGDQLNALQNYRRYVEISGTRSELRVINRVSELEAALGETANATPVPTQGTTNTTASDAPVYVGIAMTLPSDPPAIIAAEQDLREQANNQGFTEELLAQLDTLISENPTSAPLLALRAEWKMRDEATLEQAFADIQAAIEANDQHPAGYLTLSAYYTVIEYDTEKMLEYSNFARQLAPDNGLVAFIQGTLFNRHSRTSEAAQAFVDAEALGGAPLPNILVERASAYENLGMWAELAADMTRLIEIDVDGDPLYNLRLALAYLQLGKNAEALETINAWMPNADFYPEFYIHAAYVAYAAGELEQAREWLGTGIALLNESSRSDYTLGLIEMAAGNYPAALEAFAKVEGTDPSDYGYPYLNVGLGHLLIVDQVRTLSLAGEQDGAFELINSAIAQNPTEASYYLQRAMMDDARGLDNALRVDLAIGLNAAWHPTVIQQFQTEILTRGDDFTFEITYLMVLFYNHPDARALMAIAKPESENPSRYDWLEGIILSRENPDEALALGEKLVAENAENPYAYLVLSAYYDNRDEAQYSTNVKTAFELNSSEPYIAREYARALWTEGDREGAVAAYETAETLGLNPLYFLTEKGYLQSEMGDLPGASDTYKRYFDLEGSRPGTDEMYRWLMIALWAGEPQAALDIVNTYQAHVDVDVDDLPTYEANLAYIALQAGDLDLADKFLASSADVNPDSARLKYMQALLAYAKADYATALTLLNEVSSMDENEYYSPFLNNDFGHSVALDLAKTYAGLGQNDDARAAFEAVITDNPYWVQPYLERAQFFVSIGEIELARADLQTAFDMTNDPILKAQIRDMLLELGE